MEQSAEFTAHAVNQTVVKPPNLQQPVLFYGPINDGNSCYMDSILVALFVPYHNGYFNNLFSTRIEDTTAGITRWEIQQSDTATLEWKNAVQASLRVEATRMRDITRNTVWSLRSFRKQFASCKFAVANEFGHMQPVDFSTNQQQSALDFIRYLFHILGVRDNICVYQQSTTLFDRRPLFSQHTTLHDLTTAWQIASCAGNVTYTPETAHMMHDPDEAQALHHAPSGTRYIINSTGDRMRISADETSAIMLCQMTAADLYSGPVSLTRHIEPHIEIIETDSSYVGTLFAKMHSTHIDVTQTHVLLFEVSRNIGNIKVETPVYFGQLCGNSWNLYLQNRTFQLSAVVCHGGTTTAGHYVSFVYVSMESSTKNPIPDSTTNANSISNHSKDEHQWCFYDDLTGHGLPVTPENMMNHAYSPSQYGELFIYTLLPVL